MTNSEMIDLAASIVKTRKTKGTLCGDVGSALLSRNGNIYLGVCADLGSSGFCVEQNAIGSMITEGQYKIAKIVAVEKTMNNHRTRDSSQSDKALTQHSGSS